MKYLKSLSAVQQNELDLTGVRVKDLALLSEQKFSVPDSFVVLSTAFTDLVELNSLKYKIDYILKHVSKTSSQSYVNAWTSARKAIRDAKLPGELESELKEMFEGLISEGIGLSDGKKQPVRMILSTNLNSDSESNDTIIQNIQGWNEFMIALRECWALVYNPSQLKPRMDSGVNESELRIAVLVQVMHAPATCCHAYSGLPMDKEKIYLQTYYGNLDLRDKIKKDHYALMRNGLNIVLSDIKAQPEIIELDEKDELSVVPFDGKTEHDKLIPREVQELARQVKKAERALNAPLKVFFESKDEMHTVLWVNRLGFKLEQPE